MSHRSESSCNLVAACSLDNPVSPMLNMHFRSSNIPLHLLPLHSLLRIRTGLLLLLRQQLNVVQSVQARCNVARQSHEPRAISLPLDSRASGELADASLIQVGQGIEGEVDGIAELTAHSQVLEDWVQRLGVGCYRGRFEVLDELSETHRFARVAEALLDRIVGCDGGCGVVGAVEVPRKETREVLDCSQSLVAANYGECLVLIRLRAVQRGAGHTSRRDEAVEVAHGRVVD